jgi:dephospho-CoA kinase
MILVGLTGGIGSGKSTVSSMLAALGAEIIDADAVTREVQQPGSAVVAAIADRFGDELLDGDGALIRADLADIVFNDPDALRDLNVVVLDIPLLTEKPRAGLQGKIVVDVPVEVQVERLVRYRGFTEDDARARIANQASRDDRLKDADFVIDNSGEPDDLREQVTKLWQWITALPQLPEDFSFAP